MKITFTWDDGAQEDLRLIELHRKHEIPGMFFVPTQNSEGKRVLTREQIRENASELIQFGGHTQHHTYLTSISLNDVEDEIKNNKLYLEEILGEKMNHFCLPGGKYNSDILKIVYQHYDTCRTADTMAIVRDEKLVKPTFHFYPRGLKSIVGNSLKQRNASLAFKSLTHANLDYFKLLRYLTEEIAQIEDSYVVLWGHSWEIEEVGLWDKLEEYMVFLKRNYAAEIVAYDELFSSSRGK